MLPGKVSLCIRKLMTNCFDSWFGMLTADLLSSRNLTMAFRFVCYIVAELILVWQFVTLYLLAVCWCMWHIFCVKLVGILLHLYFSCKLIQANVKVYRLFLLVFALQNAFPHFYKSIQNWSCNIQSAFGLAMSDSKWVPGVTTFIDILLLLNLFCWMCDKLTTKFSFRSTNAAAFFFTKNQ